MSRTLVLHKRQILQLVERALLVLKQLVEYSLGFTKISRLYLQLPHDVFTLLHEAVAESQCAMACLRQESYVPAWMIQVFHILLVDVDKQARAEQERREAWHSTQLALSLLAFSSGSSLVMEALHK